MLCWIGLDGEGIRKERNEMRSEMLLKELKVYMYMFV